MSNQCDTCKFFEGHGQNTAGGVCRRRPPTVFVIPDRLDDLGHPETCTA